MNPWLYQKHIQNIFIFVKNVIKIGVSGGISLHGIVYTCTVGGKDWVHFFQHVFTSSLLRVNSYITFLKQDSNFTLLNSYVHSTIPFHS